MNLNKPHGLEAHLSDQPTDSRSESRNAEPHSQACTEGRCDCLQHLDPVPARSDSIAELRHHLAAKLLFEITDEILSLILGQREAQDQLCALGRRTNMFNSRFGSRMVAKMNEPPWRLRLPWLAESLLLFLAFTRGNIH